jgi:hypothetical protein
MTRISIRSTFASTGIQGMFTCAGAWAAAPGTGLRTDHSRDWPTSRGAADPLTKPWPARGTDAGVGLGNQGANARAVAA